MTKLVNIPDEMMKQICGCGRPVILNTRRRDDSEVLMHTMTQLHCYFFGRYSCEVPTASSRNFKVCTLGFYSNSICNENPKRTNSIGFAPAES